VLQGLEAPVRGRTCVLVTHQMGGLEAMGHIIPLAGGRRIERGTPEAVPSGAGFCRRLGHRQFLQEKSA
jgi:ATP-binding cassette, subfamily B, bacterial AbcA/BmrA